MFPTPVRLFTYLMLCISFSVSALAQVNVYTRSYDNARTGANLQETVLTQKNVNATNFGKLFTVHTDGQIFAQPLYVSNLAIAGGTHNVVFAASMRNTVYAIDADSGTVLWSQNFGTPIVPQDVESDQNISWSTGLGILSTPVIDPATNYMYFVSGEQPAGTQNYSYNLNAIDITTGLPVNGSPTMISAQYQGLNFNPAFQTARPGMALANGNVYIAFASHEDRNAYHGWVMAYSTSTLAQTAVYVDTPNGVQGGIWNAGQAPSIDSVGDLYISTGNGSFGTTTNGLTETGNSFIKLTPDLKLLDYFTPTLSASMNQIDQDLGSSGLLLVPGTTHILGGGKEGVLYLTDTGNLGKFNTSSNQVLQEFQAVRGNGSSHIHGGPVYYNSNVNGPSVYVWGENDTLRGFQFDATGLLTTAPFAQSLMTAPVTNASYAMPGGFLAVSANGNQDGIVWASTPYNADALSNVVDGVLYAFNAENLSVLWTDKTNLARDDVGEFAKYVPPVVANGKMYIPNFGTASTTDGSGNLLCYGLLTQQPAQLNVKVANATMTVGGTVPTLTGTVTGLVNGDTVGTTIIVTYSTTATPASPAGTYPITAVVTGSSVGNYNVTVIAGTLTVTAATVPTLTVTANNATRVYNTPNPTFTGTVTGAQNGDTFAETFSTTATQASAVGSYPIVPTASGADLSNYTVNAVNGTLTVSQASQTITFPAIASLVYGSAPFAVAATSSAGANYPVTVTVASGPATIAGGMVTLTGAGTVVLKASQAGDTNYSAATATQSIVVAPAQLVAIANNQGREFNTPNPTLSGSVTGAVGSDSFTETFSTTATISSNVGSYPIVPAVTGPTANYTVTLTNGALRVTGAKTTTALTAPSSATDGSSVTLTATVSSTAGTPDGSVTFTSGATSLGMGTLAGGVASLNTTALPVGTDTVTATYAAAGNFAGSSGTANLTVASGATQSGYTVTANPAAVTVQMGKSANTKLTFTPSGGYSGTIVLICSNLPANVSCSFAQSSIMLTGDNQAANVALTINTTAASAGRRAPESPVLLVLAFWWPGGLTGLAVFARKRRSKMPRLVQLCLLLLCTCAFAVGLSGCGTSTSSSTGTETAQVSVVATGTAASGVSVQNVTLSLTVIP